VSRRSIAEVRRRAIGRRAHSVVRTRRQRRYLASGSEAYLRAKDAALPILSTCIAHVEFAARHPDVALGRAAAHAPAVRAQARTYGHLLIARATAATTAATTQGWRAGVVAAQRLAELSADARNAIIAIGALDRNPRVTFVQARSVTNESTASTVESAASPRAPRHIAASKASGLSAARWVPLLIAAVLAVVMLAVVPRTLAAFQRMPAPAVGAPTSTTARDAGVVISVPATPTPQVTIDPTPAYLVGAWMAQDVTGSTGTDTIYVRVTRGVSQQPAPGVGVTASVTFTCASRAAFQTFGPVTTGPDGVAAVPIGFNGLPLGQPVCVAVTAHTDAGALTATTTFVAG
jgi:hypothetical protein